MAISENDRGLKTYVADDRRDELQKASSENGGDACYEGLRPSGDDAFPKECRNCGRIYNTPDDFFSGTANFNAEKIGLREIFDEDAGVLIEAYRNCLAPIYLGLSQM